jgi:phage terminase large subunit
VQAFEGAYFAQMLSEAKAQGRIGKVAADPLLPLRAFIDIGGSGATADAFTIWIVQWVGAEIVTGIVGAVWLGVKVMLGK